MNCHREIHGLDLYVFPRTVTQNISYSEHCILNNLTAAFGLPAAAEIPLREPRTWSGKVSDGSMNVVEFGPKLLKKKVKLSVTLS